MLVGSDEKSSALMGRVSPISERGWCAPRVVDYSHLEVTSGRKNRIFETGGRGNR